MNDYGDALNQLELFENNDYRSSLVQVVFDGVTREMTFEQMLYRHGGHYVITPRLEVVSLDTGDVMGIPECQDSALRLKFALMMTDCMGVEGLDWDLAEQRCMGA